MKQEETEFSLANIASLNKSTAKTATTAKSSSTSVSTTTTNANAATTKTNGSTIATTTTTTNNGGSNKSNTQSKSTSKANCNSSLSDIGTTSCISSNGGSNKSGKEKSKTQQHKPLDVADESEKQMVGGCCVCADDTGYIDNVLVYCDGEECQVAVHQGCYGITNVPDGPWYCRRCEHKRSINANVTFSAAEKKCEIAKLCCQLCPHKEGAIKRTDNGKWAHVVCALYIPEVSFGNVRTMEPIVIKDVRADRLNKKCSLCESSPEISLSSSSNKNLDFLMSNDTNDSCSTIATNSGIAESSVKAGENVGHVYVNCNKPVCKHWFHVTCAQASGLLCETNSNSTPYCIYCKNHFLKIAKQNSGVKQIPAFRLTVSHSMSDPLLVTVTTPDLSKESKRKKTNTPKESLQKSTNGNKNSAPSTNNSNISTSSSISNIDPDASSKKTRRSNSNSNSETSKSAKTTTTPNSKPKSTSSIKSSSSIGDNQTSCENKSSIESKIGSVKTECESIDMKMETPIVQEKKSSKKFSFASKTPKQEARSKLGLIMTQNDISQSQENIKEPSIAKTDSETPIKEEKKSLEIEDETTDMSRLKATLLEDLTSELSINTRPLDSTTLLAKEIDIKSENTSNETLKPKDSSLLLQQQHSTDSGISSLCSLSSTTSTSSQANVNIANDELLAKSTKRKPSSNADEPVNNFDAESIGVVDSTSSKKRRRKQSADDKTNDKDDEQQTKEVMKQLDMRIFREDDTFEEFLTRQYELGADFMAYALLSDESKSNKLDVCSLFRLIDDCKSENVMLRDRLAQLELKFEQLTSTNARLTNLSCQKPTSLSALPSTSPLTSSSAAFTSTAPVTMASTMNKTVQQQKHTNLDSLKLISNACSMPKPSTNQSNDSAFIQAQQQPSSAFMPTYSSAQAQSSYQQSSQPQHSLINSSSFQTPNGKSHTSLMLPNTSPISPSSSSPSSSSFLNSLNLLNARSNNNAHMMSPLTNVASNQNILNSLLNAVNASVNMNGGLKSNVSTNNAEFFTNSFSSIPTPPPSTTSHNTTSTAQNHHHLPNQSQPHHHMPNHDHNNIHNQSHQQQLNNHHHNQQTQNNSSSPQKPNPLNVSSSQYHQFLNYYLQQAANAAQASNGTNGNSNGSSAKNLELVASKTNT